MIEEIGKRMKRYEEVSNGILTPRMPVLIRIDGKCFKNYTSGLEKPFDEIFRDSMKQTMLYLCKNIQGCVMGYTQSDEITLILVDYKELKSECWFGGDIQKITSVSASMATMAFNKAFQDLSVNAFYKEKTISKEKFDLLLSKIQQGAIFDSRVFNIPKEDVTNCLLWRQMDAKRNSINSIGRTYFTKRQLDRKNNSDVLKMLLDQYGISIDSFKAEHIVGCTCIKEKSQNSDREEWVIDKNVVLFSDNREYIEKLIK